MFNVMVSHFVVCYGMLWYGIGWYVTVCSGLL